MLTDNKAVAAGTAHGSIGYCALNSTTTTDPEPFSLAAPEVFQPPEPQQIQARFDALTAGGWTQAGIVSEVRKRGIKLDPGDFSNARRGKHGKKLSREQWHALQALPVDHQDDVVVDNQNDSAVDHQDDEQAGVDLTTRRAEAERYLAILDSEAESFTFQTFDDTEAKRGHLAQTIVGDLESVWSQLERLNQAGAGVFVTVNETRGQTRRAGDVVRVRACFADYDPPKTAPAPALADYPLAPVMLVESSPGKTHTYWTVDGLDLLHFKPMQQAISGRLGSDPAPNDLPRVMRLPGFYHCKNPDHRHLVRVVWTDERQPYQAEQVRAAFGQQRQQQQVQHQATEQTDTARPADTDPVVQALTDKGLLLQRRRDGGWHIRCPWESEHTTPSTPTSSTYFPAHTGGYAGAAYKCQHSHCAERGIFDLKEHLGIDPWPDLESLHNITEPEPYPLDALPERVRAAVAEVQGFVKAPLPLVATSALSVLSVATQGHVDVARAEKLKGPSSLFMLAIADSGERKSTVDGFFTAAIREYEAKQHEAMKSELEDYRAAMKKWQAECDGLLTGIRQSRKAGKSEKVKEYGLALQDLEHSKPAEPRVPRLLRGDDTPEALAWSLAKQWPSAGVLSSEAGVIFGAHGMGKDSVMRNLALLNILWDGGCLDIGRRTTESFTVKGARFTVGLMVQEQTLREYFDRAGALARGSGFLARFLVCWPKSTQGMRPFTDPPEHWPALARFNSRLSGILESPVVPDEDGRLSPHLLTLAPDAKALWVQFHDAIEAELAPAGELHEVRDVAAKVADNAARLAALFHVFEHNLADPIGVDIMERAVRIVTWHLSEARRFFGELAVPPATLAAAQLEQWLVGHCRAHGVDTVKRKEVQQLVTPAALRRGDKLTDAILTLAEHGRVRERVDGKKKLLQVRPEVLAA
ncbi:MULTISPECIES: DUF3987 domain-containing protein [Thiorhodovibrio]|uniref:DUF3987 domain-containing protein n=1 Tax=Thiorhodovibrio TaxID=61593 RepID=UPI0019126D77|nr:MULTISPECIES: DUF3987 domain-containing protein [Thiorhodovibrio]MBK5970905.1 hypothetical protein [Thiorhodovibrio winogradskyi]WPL11362.1 hypothetical protein Thiosp_01095 [Thiorhodovibrio litoralis]WPL14031.1 hypothetical protein Thiosp_03862 [Thiorhodovibrio litoralis]